MAFNAYLTFSLLCVITAYASTTIIPATFPTSFKFGVATAAYQVEGAWNEDGKTENIWDFFTHTYPDKIIDRSNGDIACDAYHKIDEDVMNLKQLKVHFYRLSISWCRILPLGYRSKNTSINALGVNYYNRLINKLVENGIEPVVTIYHWDLPQRLQEIGGWANREMVDYFADYARLLYELYGDRVKRWITFNEPLQVCLDGYGTGTLAPGYMYDGVAGYSCAHHLLLAHAKAYHIYQREFRMIQQGVIGLAIHTAWFEPKTQSDDDIKAAERITDFYFGWFANPVYSKEGDYPRVLRQRVDALSALQGFKKSRLPRFTPQEVKELRGSADFLGLNHYTTLLTEAFEQYSEKPSAVSDAGVRLSWDPNWEGTARDVFRVVPWGLRKTLNRIRDKYDNPLVLITENGYAGFANETTMDVGRIRYYNGYLQATLDAITKDHCNVIGFTAWSYMDNYEWFDGYTMRFGMYHVDFTNINRPRVPKMSAFVYQNIITTRSINHTLKPKYFLH